MYPTTTVRIGINGHVVNVRMAVSDQFVFDALLGTDIPGLNRMIETALRRQPARLCRTKDIPLPSGESTDEEGWEIARPRRQRKPKHHSGKPKPSSTDFPQTSDSSSTTDAGRPIDRELGDPIPPPRHRPPPNPRTTKLPSPTPRLRRVQTALPQRTRRKT